LKAQIRKAAPQVSALFPVHGSLQSVVGADMVG
jgi:hypothetical protein